MVYSGTAPDHFVIRHFRALGQKPACTLHRMTQTNDSQRTDASGCEAHHAHRVGIVQDDRIRTEPLGITEDFNPHRYGAESLEQAAGTNRVPNTLINTILGGISLSNRTHPVH